MGLITCIFQTFSSRYSRIGFWNATEAVSSAQAFASKVNHSASEVALERDTGSQVSWSG